MANSYNELSDDEAKYFESRGEYEPEGYNSAPTEDSQTTETESSEQGSEGLGARFDESASEGDGGEDEGAGVYDEAEASESQQVHTSKSSKRDFEKAYGIAESKRQELLAHLEAQTKQNQLLQQQLQSLMQQQQTSQVKQSDINVPDPEIDPLGYQAFQLEQLNKTVKAQQDYLMHQERTWQEQQKMGQFVNAYKQSALVFAQEAPDFKDAYSFLEQSRIQEYLAAGYSQQDSTRLLHEDEMAIAAKAFKDGVNPASRVYALAKARGYNATNPESRLEKVSEGMQKSKTLPRAGGKNMEKGFDMSRLDDMSDAEFDKFFSQLKAEAKKKGEYRKDFY